MEKPPEIGSRVAVVPPGGVMAVANVVAIFEEDGRVLVRVRFERGGEVEDYPLGAVEPLE